MSAAVAAFTWMCPRCGTSWPTAHELDAAGRGAYVQEETGVGIEIAMHCCPRPVTRVVSMDDPYLTRPPCASPHAAAVTMEGAVETPDVVRRRQRAEQHPASR